VTLIHQKSVLIRSSFVDHHRSNASSFFCLQSLYFLLLISSELVALVAKDQLPVVRQQIYLTFDFKHSKHFNQITRSSLQFRTQSDRFHFFSTFAFCFLARRPATSGSFDLTSCFSSSRLTLRRTLHSACRFRLTQSTFPLRSVFARSFIRPL
jgi:hypothetical protein